MANRDSDTLEDRPPDHQIESTRTSRVWLAVAVALVLMLLAGIFIAQNGNDVALEFLVWDWTVSLGLGLFFAAILGALTVLMLGVARMIQLRRTATRHRHEDDEAREPAGEEVETSRDRHEAA